MSETTSNTASAFGSRSGEVVFAMPADEARAVWHSICTTVQLMDQVAVPPHAPLYGWRDRLVAAARRLDHEINHAPAPNPESVSVPLLDQEAGG